MKRPTILDASGRPLSLGDKIDGGPDPVTGTIIIGTLVEFIDADEYGWKVAVEWPGGLGDPEIFPTAPRNYRLEGPIGPYTLQCSDIDRAE